MLKRIKVIKKIAVLCVLTLLGTIATAAFENELPVKRTPAPKPVAKPVPNPAPVTVPAPVHTPTYRAGQVYKDCADCPEMVVIPAGSFLMGSPESEKDRKNNEGPQRTVTIETYAIGKTEVTVGQFRRFVEIKNYKTDAEININEKGCRTYEDGKWYLREGRTWRNPGWAIKETEPVVCISRWDVLAYLGWINEKSLKIYSLPSEAQWEYAARAGSQTIRSWGDNPDDACKHANVADKTKKPINGNTWTTLHDCSDGYWFVAPVASYQANAFGLHDMHGNVSEWTEDRWHDDYRGAPTNSSAWLQGLGLQNDVLRGGSWADDPQSLRSARRFRSAPNDRYSNVGFRLARMLP
jgi:formylglycine-generating enzyme